MSAFEPDAECVFCRPNPRVVWAENGLKLCSDLGPLADGHALLVTEQHYPSAADMDPEITHWVDVVDAALRAVYTREFEAFAMFEHGRTGHCLRSRPGERLCHHMHVHFLPLPFDLGALSGFKQCESWTSWQDVVALGREADGYVITNSMAVGRRFFPVSHGLPPHFLRTQIAEALGAGERADWERFGVLPDGERLARESHATVARLGGLLDRELRLMRSLSATTSPGSNA